MTHNEILDWKYRTNETIPSSYSGKLLYRMENVWEKVRAMFRDIWGMELTTLENGRVHYFGRGKFAQPNPNTALREKHGISSYNLKTKRVIHEGGGRGDGGAAQFPNWGKHVRGIIWPLYDVSLLPNRKLERKGRISLYQNNVHMRGQNIGKQWVLYLNIIFLNLIFFSPIHQNK